MAPRPAFATNQPSSSTDTRHGLGWEHETPEPV
jgi:hypothetical protein